MPRFAFETDVQAPVALMTLRGELDQLVTAEFERELDRLAAEPQLEVVALDLRELVFLDSSGLRAIMVAGKKLDAEDRRLVLVRGCQAVQRIFEITRMTERLEFVDAPGHVLT